MVASRRYDFLVSYAHEDGREYAFKLTQGLVFQDLRVFIDRGDINAGAQLSKELRKAVQRSSALVVVGTPGAVESRFVRGEIELAVDLKKQIIPIDVGGAVEGCPDFLQLIGPERIRLDDGLDGPSPTVLLDLPKALASVRVEEMRRRRALVRTWSTIAVLLAAAVFAGMWGYDAFATRRTEAQERADRELARAQDFAEHVSDVAGRTVDRLDVFLEDPANEANLREALYRTRACVELQRIPKGRQVLVGSDWLVVVRGNRADAYDLLAPRPEQPLALEADLLVPAPEQPMLPGVDYSPDSTYGFLGESPLLYQTYGAPQLALWDLNLERSEPTLILDCCVTETVVADRTGRFLGLHGLPGHVEAYDLGDASIPRVVHLGQSMWSDDDPDEVYSPPRFEEDRFVAYDRVEGENDSWTLGETPTTPGGLWPPARRANAHGPRGFFWTVEAEERSVAFWKSVDRAGEPDLSRVPGPSDWEVTSFQLDHAGSRAAMATASGEITIWNLLDASEPPRELATGHGGTEPYYSLTGNGQLLAYMTGEGEVVLVDLRQSPSVPPVLVEPRGEINEKVAGLSLSPHGRWLAVIRQWETALLFDLGAGRKRYEVGGRSCGFSAGGMCFDDGERFLVSGSQDGDTVQVCSLPPEGTEPDAPWLSTGVSGNSLKWAAFADGSARVGVLTLTDRFLLHDLSGPEVVTTDLVLPPDPDAPPAPLGFVTDDGGGAWLSGELIDFDDSDARLSTGPLPVPVAVSSSRGILVHADESGAVYLTRASEEGTFEGNVRLPGPPIQRDTVTTTRDGSRVAGLGEDGALYVWTTSWSVVRDEALRLAGPLLE